MKLSKQTIEKIERIHYKGKLYNLTTTSGNLIANDILCKNSGGLGTPAHLRVQSGMIHKAHNGVLFIDEIATLGIRTQQELLTAMQEGLFPITGRSEKSAGAMVRTKPVPCKFILVAAGNLETVKGIHPALRSRIRGYGYEVYVNDTIEDTPQNRLKIARFVAQEVKKDKKIPPFSRDAVIEIIEEAKRRSGTRGKLSLVLRELGGIIRAAGDIAVESKKQIVEREDVIKSKKYAVPLEKQVADKYIERKKEYEVIKTVGKAVGRVNALAVIGNRNASSGIVLPIESQVTLGGKRSEIIATGKLGEIAKEAIKNVSAIIRKYFGEDIQNKYDIYVQFLQAYEGVEGDSASIAVATSIISALKNLPIKQDMAMTGSLSVRGDVLPVGGVSQKVEAAINANLKQVIVPESNIKDITLPSGEERKITITPVKTILDVLKAALDLGKNKRFIAELAKE